MCTITGQPEVQVQCTRCLRHLPESATRLITSTTYRGTGRQKRQTIYNTLHRVCLNVAECDAASSQVDDRQEAVS